MNKIRLLKELERYAMFNNKTLRDITGKTSSYVKLIVYRLKKEGFIFEIEKNKCTVHKDPLLIASKIVWPSYLSGWTALRYYNLTEQLPSRVFVITTRARKKSRLEFENTEIIFIKIKPKYFFGFNKENYSGFTIFMADPEKALIDSALFKKISFSELYSIMEEHKKEINTKLIIAYLRRIKNKALIKRFGFAFDKLGFDFFDKLKKSIDNKYVFLDYAAISKGKRNKKWRIIENAEL